MAAKSTKTEGKTGADQQLSADKKPDLVGLVLAAGRASRFGSDKRQAQYDGQHTMLGRAIELIEQHCSQLIIVTRPEDEKTGAALLGSYHQHPKVEQFIAVDALHGMGSSLANGISRVIACEQQRDQAFDGALVMLADMPYIREQTIASLVSGFSADKITIPCYLEPYKEKKWGNPVLFSRKWFDALQGLRGDRGARSLIKANPCSRVELVVDDPGILHDVDTPADFEACA